MTGTGLGGYGLDEGETAASQGLGDVGDRREVQDPADRRDRVGEGLDPVAPGVLHLACPLDRPEHRAGVELGRLVEHDLDRYHDAEVAAAKDDEALLGRRIDDVGPDRAGLDAGAACRGVDLDAAQARGLHEDRGVERVERARTVAGSLRGDPEAMSACELDDRDDVVGGVDERDREGTLVDGEVPGLSRGIPVGVARKHDLTADAGAPRADVGATRGLGDDADLAVQRLVVGRLVGARAFGCECHRASSVSVCCSTEDASRLRRRHRPGGRCEGLISGSAL
jgi:hypothetical protein